MHSLRVLFLLILCQCVFTYAQIPKKFFRSDYTYFESTNSFYKIHTMRKTWYGAKNVCAMEGASLFYPENENEADVVTKFLTKSQPFQWVFVGAHGNESLYVTIEGVPVSNKFYKWVPGEPDGSGQFYNCVVLTREATLKDEKCTIINPFICKKTQSSLEWNSLCNMPKQDTQLPEMFFRTDYTYLESTRGFYKIHTSDSWISAKKKCAAEGASLFYPEDKHEVDAVTEFYEREFFISSGSDWRLYIGGSSYIAEGVYETIDGFLVSNLYNNWAPGEPSALNYKDCMVLMHDGTLRDVDCDRYYNFICKIPLSSLDLSILKNTKLDYEYNAAAGRCYKFHLNPLSWSDAYATCAAELSYLAIINSDVEADVLANLTARAPTKRVAGDFMRGMVHLGFHNLFNEGWRTAKGVPLADSGYSRWSKDEPNGEDNKECGSMDVNGQLNDIFCSSKLFFICEHEIDFSMALNERVDVVAENYTTKETALDKVSNVTNTNTDTVTDDTDTSTVTEIDNVSEITIFTDIGYTQTETTSLNTTVYSDT